MINYFTNTISIMSQSLVNSLRNHIESTGKQLLIWDFDQTIFTLDWFSGESIHDFLERIYNSINKVNSSIIKDKNEFIERLFPYPEIDMLGVQSGQDARAIPVDVMNKKEMANIDSAKPENDVINFIQDTRDKYNHVIWSNNTFESIKILLERVNLENIFSVIASLDILKRAKPDIEGFNKITKPFPNIAKESMLMIGDSLRSDKAAAENADIDFFHYK